MHMSLSIGAMFALYGQVYSQIPLGTFNIRQVETSGPTEYLDVSGPILFFQEENHQSSQVWNIASAGEGLVTIQNKETGDYINCGTSGRICQPRKEGQIFREGRVPQTTRPVYGFIEQSSSKVLVRSETGGLSLRESDSYIETERKLFWLEQVQCK